MFFVLGVSYGIEEVSVAGEAAHILRRASTDGPDQAWICGARDRAIDFLDLDHVVPVVAKVIDVMDGLGSQIFDHVKQAGFAGGHRAIVKTIWVWHAIEETEHKAVAYDVFLEVTKGWPAFKRYFRRSLSMLLITKHFTANIANFSAMLLEADGYTREEADRAVKEFLWKKPALFGRGWKVWLSWFKPGFHPWDHDNRHAMNDWKEALTPVPAE